MKLIKFLRYNKVTYGLIHGSNIQQLDGNIFDGFSKTTKESIKISDVKILPPCTPSKIVAIGLNYIEDKKMVKTKQIPIIFIKPSSTIIGTEENIIVPKKLKRIHFEAELGVVIKKEAKNIKIENSRQYILGYTCLNDVTSRDLLTSIEQLTRAKSFDTFCPIGPIITDEIDPNNVKIASFLNGNLKQNSNTNMFIYRVEEIISFVSNIMTLYPGDIIATGTPSGIGPMKKNDIIEIQIEGIGTLKNYVK